MHTTDPIADMLTRIRNANSAKHICVDVPASNVKKAIAEILLEEGYIKNYQIIEDGKQNIIRIALKDVYKRQPLGVTDGTKIVTNPEGADIKPGNAMHLSLIHI